MLGTVSRITPMKGVEYALHAVAKLADTHPGLRYLVVGDGDALEACQALARQLGITDRVIFAGYREEVGRYLAAMDLFLFPSLKEAMGIALVEAMALGLPIVATDVGGIPEVIDTSCGIMVKPRSAEALADATAELLAAPDRMSALGRRALERQRTMFSPETMERDTEKIYRQLIGPRTGELASVPAGITA
jgi:glycosyltransferase involved in cell wall biosynthesis